jgi:Resolvase, N terminal domain
MIYGYARVSTAAEDESGQVAQLKTAGCEKVFREKVTGTTADRPQLKRLMRRLAPGDIVIATAVEWRAGVARLGRAGGESRIGRRCAGGDGWDRRNDPSQEESAFSNFRRMASRGCRRVPLLLLTHPLLLADEGGGLVVLLRRPARIWVIGGCHISRMAGRGSF